MAKSSKESKEAAAPEINRSAPDKEARNGDSPAKAAKPAVAKRRAAKVVKSASRPKSDGKTHSAKPRKKPATRQLLATSSKRKATPDSMMISEEEIRVRAYFIAERRMREGIQGNSSDDWLEARRQLLIEAGQRA